MTPARAALLLLLLSATACDTASVYEQCRAEDKIGTGEARCQPSRFDPEQDFAREVSGYVSYGIQPQANAIVRVDDTTVTTNVAGAYHWRDAPLHYDLTARFEHDVISYRGAAMRFLDIALDRDAAVMAYSGTVKLRVENVPRAGDKLAFFASGDVVSMHGSLEDGFTVASRSFDAVTTIHVVEYPEADGILGAVAKGSVDVTVRANTETVTSVFLAPVFESNEVTFTAKPPSSGFTVGDVELIVDFGTRLSEMILPKRFPLDVPVRFPVMSNAGWTARLRATRDGDIALNGRRLFKPADEKSIELFLFDPPISLAPLDGGVAAGGKLSATGVGVLEHLLEPLDSPNDVTLHLLTTERETPVPDLTTVGLPPAKGRYRWTVRNYPDYTFTDQISGLNVRLYPASGTSAPRTIVLP